MDSLTHARPLTPDDQERLEPIDRAHTLLFGLEPVVTRGSVSFYVRSGHAFVSQRAGQVTGFVLAHAVWNGQRPVVQVNRLAVAEAGDHASRLALLEAVTKSGYDAAVYDIQVQLVAHDSAGRLALEAKQYHATPLMIFERVLGSRGRAGNED
jgi:hypothetical protein